MHSYKAHSIGYEDLVKELLDIYAEGLRNRSEAEVDESTDKFFSKSSAFFGYVEPTIKMLLNTHEVVLVTGSSHFTAKAVAKVFGVNNYISTVLSVKDGLITGKIDSYLATRHEKKEAVHYLTETHPYDNSFGFGDSEGDIEMLKVVQNPICIQPTLGLLEVAQKHRWTIINEPADLASHSGLLVVKQILNT